MKSFIILTPSLCEHDAVSYDVFTEQKILLEQGHQAIVYSQYADEFARKKIVPRNKVLEALQNNRAVTFYHHSILWEDGAELFDLAKGPIIFCYHNITPARFFAENSLDIQRQVILGRWQTQHFIDSKKINFYINDSSYNSEELARLGANSTDLHEVAPFHQVESFNTLKEDRRVVARIEKKKTNILFVGRVASNKGQLNLVRLVERYQEIYGDTIHLYLVGKISAMGYAEKIFQYIKDRNLENCVTFHIEASVEELNSYYHHCQIFVCLSEHEGFGLPLIEAQYRNMPIIALDRTAVKGTLGEDQLTIKDFDLDHFCAAIRVIAKNKSYRDFLVKKGQENFEKYTFATLKAKFLDIIEQKLPG